MTKRSQLTAAFCKTAPPGKHQDGQGLMLWVKPTGGKSWVQRIVINGKRRDLGLGSYEFVSLSEARDKAFENRKAARTGKDPVADKTIPTFAAAVEQVIALNRHTWKNGASERQWRGEFAKYALPVIGDRRVDTIQTGDVLSVILPRWNERTSTMARIRGRMKQVFDWAIASGFRTDNPAGEAVSAILPRCKPATVHREALPHAEVAAVLYTVRDHNRTAATTRLALECIALTACRSGEVTGATWEEIDLEAAVWTIPAARMKKGRAHRVPLSSRAIEVLERAKVYADGSGLVFPSVRGKQLANGVLSRSLKDMGVQGTVHGFRSSFADWAAECTDTPAEVVERALAHIERNAVRAAYTRTDHLDARRGLLQAWADYLTH